MKTIYTLFLSVFFFFTLNISTLEASHFAGTGLTYTCLGGNTYQITMTFYRDCSGVPEPANVSVQFKCSSNPNFNFTASLHKIPNTGQEITPSCSQVPTSCNGGNNYGIKEYVYQTQVTLVPCNHWTMIYTSCCRNPISTLSNSTSDSWYIEAMLNNLDAPCNSSPVFKNKPVLVVCNNRQIKYNPGAVEVDSMDIMKFSFYAPMTINNIQHVSYLQGFSDTNFLVSSTPITLDSMTGEISLFPISKLITTTGIKVEEWRVINGVNKLIGYVMRDVQLMVDDCYGSPPVLSGIDLQNTHTYNPNDTLYSIVHHTNTGVLEFDLNGFDADTFNAGVLGNPETFSISWNNGIPGATMVFYNNNTDSAYAHFEWNYFTGVVSPIPYCFTATIKDNACAYNSVKTYTYCITMAPPNIGIDETEKSKGIKVYPIPANDFLKFEFKDPEKIIRAEIYDNNGRKLIGKDNPDNNKIDIKNLKTGVYFYRIYTEDNVFNGKFVK